jgi:hypothetical protein
MNRNMELLDAIIGAYFVVGSLQGVWENSTVYAVSDTIVDPTTSAVWQCQVAHISASIPTTFAEERAAHATYWTIFSSPARARGAWTAFTNYAINDFVVSGSQYAVAIETHTSGASFAADLAAGKWSVLVDLSTAGSLVLPVPSGGPDANNIVTTNAAGTAYIIRTVADTLTMLGATSVGTAMFTAGSQADGRTAIGAQVAGSYQPLDADLTSIASNGISAFGLAVILWADAAAARAAITPLTNNYDIWSRVGGVDARIALSGLIDGAIGSVVQGDVLIRGAAIWERLGAGADAYKALFTGGASANPAYAGTWKVLGEANPSGASSIAFTGIPSGINHIELWLELIPVTDAVNIQIQTYGADGVLDVGVGDYEYQMYANLSNGTNGSTVSGSAGSILLNNGNTIDNGASVGFGAHIRAMNIQRATYTKFVYQSHYMDSAGSLFVNIVGSGSRAEADRITGVNISSSSGNITGKCLLLGSSN